MKTNSRYTTIIFIFIMTSYTKGTRKNLKKVLKNHMVEKYEIKNSTSCAKHGRLTYSDPSLIKISSSSMRAVATVPWPTFCRKYLSILLGWHTRNVIGSKTIFFTAMLHTTSHRWGHTAKPYTILHNIIYNVTVTGQTPLNIGNETFCNNIGQWWLTWYEWKEVIMEC